MVRPLSRLRARTTAAAPGLALRFASVANETPTLGRLHSDTMTGTTKLAGQKAIANFHAISVPTLTAFVFSTAYVRSDDGPASRL
jgi:hypothetical protein